ncbi:MAG: efflux RND transporter periplasmic adaptor subunit [Bacteroidota bacterium]
MKKELILTLSTIILIVACNKPVDKKTELADLKKQKTELESKIKVLETELGKSTFETKESDRVITVAITPILAQNFKHFVEVQGIVESENIVQVTPQMGGAITGIFAQEGQIVKKGQLLATIDNQMVRESMAEIKNQWELANTVFQKQKTLWDQQIGTEIQYLQAKNNKEALEKRMATMDTQLGMARVYAPISGTIEIVRQRQGEMGAPGVPMMQIVNLTNLKVTGKVPDIYLASIKKGQSISITLPDLKKEIVGRLSNVNALVDPVSRTFGVESKIPNIGNMLKPNQIAIIKINDLAKTNSIIIDQNLIQKTELGDIVYVEVDKKAQARKVKTGISYNGQIEITEGLKIGDNLVTSGYQELVEGTPLSY